MLVFAVIQANAQQPIDFVPARQIREHSLPSGYPARPSLPVASSVPIEPLGFSPPGPFYLGEQNSMASLDFIDDDRLLFTFRVPGLIHRQLKTGETPAEDERQIRAVVIKLPEGTVESDAFWPVHDRERYLWMLKDGRFLLRDQNNLFEGDAQLQLKPLLKFPGLLLMVELDPSQQFLVSNSLEPEQAQANAGAADSSSATSAGVTIGQTPGDPTQQDQQKQQNYVVRILRSQTGQVMLVSRSRATVHLPISPEGYLENLPGRGDQWMLNLHYYSGGSHLLGNVESFCQPNDVFISASVILATGCDHSGATRLVAITTAGKTLWDDLVPSTAVRPVMQVSSDGKLLAQETIALSHSVIENAPLGVDDIKGQMVRVFNAATGEVVFESPLSPVLDAGGNVAVSPSGRRLALLNAGAIQVFALPAQAEKTGNSAGH